MARSYLPYIKLPFYKSADYKTIWMMVFLFLHPDDVPPWMSSPELLALQHNLTFPESATASPIVRRTHRCRQFSVDLSMDTISCLSSLIFVLKQFAVSFFSFSYHVFVHNLFPNMRTWNASVLSNIEDIYVPVLYILLESTGITDHA